MQKRTCRRVRPTFRAQFSSSLVWITAHGLHDANEQVRRSTLRLARGGATALATGGLLLRRRSALRRAASARAGAGRLAAAARRARRVRDLRRALLRHALLLQLLVLLLVLDARSLAGHAKPPCRGQRVPLRQRPCAETRFA